MPWIHLKFLDESHFLTHLLRKSLVAGPVGQRVGLVDHSEAQESLSLTLLIDLAFFNNLFFIGTWSQTNLKEDYLDFITTAILTGHLVAGDFLILDNAFIHFGAATWEELTSLLHVHGVYNLFLPTYSLELNPCELVFAAIKSFIKNYPGARSNLQQLIFQGLASVSYVFVLNIYSEWSGTQQSKTTSLIMIGASFPLK